MADFDFHTAPLPSRLPSFKGAMDPPSSPSPSTSASASASPSPSPSSSPSPKPIRWRKGELIGAGAFGRVYMGMNLDSGELLAVKQVLIAANSVTKEKAQAHVKELEEEVKLLQNLSHPNIVRYLGTAREDDALNIFLEFVPGGSIASLLGKFGSFPEAVIRMYTRQLLQGLQYLHKNGIMHRDIKGANILVDNKGCIKLADFGASKQVVELVTLSGAKSMKGTPYWMAPEVIRQTGHSLPADIWSVGCTIIEMATGKPPWSQQFQEVAALFHIGTTKSHPPIPEHLSLEAKDFLLKCLKKEPHLRPTAAELLKHPFANLDECVTTSASGLISHGARASQMVVDGSKRLHLDVGSKLSPHENGTDVGLSQDLFSKSFEPDLNCSVVLDTDSFTSFKSTSEPPKFYEAGWEHSDFNPMAEPTSYNPMSEPSYLKDTWCNIDSSAVNTGDTSELGMNKDSGFSFHCGSADDDDEVTESKIKAFLDDKALELKKLQTPLYKEYQSIRNVAMGVRGMVPSKPNDGCIAPVSPAAGRQLLTAAMSRSPSKVSNPSVASAAGSRESEAAISIDSPGSVNFCPHAESPKVNEWKGLLLEAQQPLSSPRTLSSSEQHRLWKEELQKELEMRREEKKMLSRLAGGSAKSSPVSKTASPRGPIGHAECGAS